MGDERTRNTKILNDQEKQMESEKKNGECSNSSFPPFYNFVSAIYYLRT
jgi:hypothetical protein